MHSYVIFNPNQEKNLLGYKVVDNSKYLNSVGPWPVGIGLISFLL